MISTPPLVLYSYYSAPYGCRFVPAPGPLLLRRCSLGLEAACFSFVAWVFARYRCFLLDYWNWKGEDSYTQEVVVPRAHLGQHLLYL